MRRLPNQNYGSRQLQRHEEIRPKTRTKILHHMTWLNPVKSLGYMKGYNLRSPRLVENLGSSTRKKLSENLGLNEKTWDHAVNQEKSRFPELCNKTRNFTNSRNKTNRRIYRSLTFLNIWTTSETFQQSGKRDCLKQLLKGSASINERSGSLFLRTNLRIQ